jgi:RNA polymerase sigma-70 factor (ECF subfamily)
MAQLVDAFRAARGTALASDSADPRPLELLLRVLYARGRAAHPEVVLDEVAFAAHLGACGAPVESLETGGDLHAEDLYLCCAALRGDAAVVRQLRQANRPVLAGYLRHIDGAPAFVDEVEQRLWDAALVPKDGATVKLLSYAGKGPLAGWLGITAQRIALSLRRHEAAEERAADRLEAEVDHVAGDPELAFVKGQLRDQFRRAVSEALAALPDHERMIYRLHVVDGLTFERIGKMYGIAHSTVSRRMASARDQIIDEAKRLLRDEMGVAPAEYESLERLLVSQLDLSVSRLLRKPM